MFSWVTERRGKSEHAYGIGRPYGWTRCSELASRHDPSLLFCSLFKNTRISLAA